MNAIKMIAGLGPIAIGLVLVSCNKQPETPADESIVMDYTIAPAAESAPSKEMIQFAPPPPSGSGQEPLYAPVDKRKIIKDGFVSIKVPNISRAKKWIDSLVKKAGAYYESEEMENYEYMEGYKLEIRVPFTKFDSFLEGTEKGEGEIITKNITARDVTDEFIDNEARLGTKKIFLKRYNELAAKAVKVEDMMTIEENIRALQEEIESTEGRLKLLSDQVTWSTISIHLNHSKEIKKAEEKIPTFFNRSSDSFKFGWQSVIRTVLWIIESWPVIVLLAIGIVVVKRIIRRIVRNRKRKVEVSAASN